MGESVKLASAARIHKYLGAISRYYRNEDPLIKTTIDALAHTIGEERRGSNRFMTRTQDDDHYQAEMLFSTYAVLNHLTRNREKTLWRQGKENLTAQQVAGKIFGYSLETIISPYQMAA